MFTWQDCAQTSLAWFGLRELLLHLLFTPALLLPLVAGGSALLAWLLRWRSPAVLALGLLSPLIPPLPGKLTPLQNDHSNQGA